MNKLTKNKKTNKNLWGAFSIKQYPRVSRYICFILKHCAALFLGSAYFARQCVREGWTVEAWGQACVDER